MTWSAAAARSEATSRSHDDEKVGPKRPGESARSRGNFVVGNGEKEGARVLDARMAKHRLGAHVPEHRDPTLTTEFGDGPRIEVHDGVRARRPVQVHRHPAANRPEPGNDDIGTARRRVFACLFPALIDGCA